MSRPISSGQLATLTYRSKASDSFSENDLHSLLDVARSRNSVSSVTGLLIYDDGRFFQWLEGPPEHVENLWGLIRKDRRHTDVELLEHAPTAERVFGGWDMKLATRASQIPVAANHPVVLSPEIVAALPKSSAATTAFIEAVPQTRSTSAVVRSIDAHRQPRSRLPLAHPRAAELARLLLAVDPADAFAVLDFLTAEAGSIAAACASISEPAARSLGELWASDDCTEVDVVLGLGRLRSGIRRVDFGPPLVTTYAGPLRAVLVVPQPGEKHVLGAALDAEVLCRDGFEPQCEFPQSDAALGGILAKRWFDAIDVSLSTAFRREDWLPRMAHTVALARRASLNPEIVVVVGGRIFYEQGADAETVGADGDHVSASSVAASIRDSMLKK
jgi:hypothetical protein